MTPKACTIRHIFISPYEIHFLRFILEAYEGIAVVTTLRPESGLVRLSIAPGCEEVIDLILSSEKKNLSLRPIRLGS